jgi:hypothetical protein
MPNDVVITEECHAKDGWNLANLGSPLFLLGGHPFLPGSTSRWSGYRVFQHQRPISFSDEHRCFLHHFLAKSSMSARLGLDVWGRVLARNPGLASSLLGNMRILRQGH